MFHVFLELNWLAIIIASVTLTILGGLWFAVLFKKGYLIALGKENNTEEQTGLLFILGPYICGLITTITTSIFIHVLNIKSIRDALILGIIIGFGLLATTTVNTAINPNMPRPLLYGLISGSYFFLSGVLVSIIIVSMR